MIKFLKKTNRKYFLILTFSLAIILGLFMGYLFYINESNKVRVEYKNNLETISKIKSREISYWYEDELYDVKIIGENKFIRSSIEQWLRSGERSDSSEIIRQLKAIEKEHSLKRIILATENNTLLLSSDPSWQVLDTCHKSYIQEAIQKKTELSTGLFKCKTHNEALISFLSPLWDNQDNLLAVLIFQLDPHNYLFPLLQDWPTSEKTAETFLITQKADSVVFLNNFGNIETNQYQPSLSIRDTNNIAVKIANGYDGFLEATDHKGQKVFAYGKNIEGTPWFIISKINRKEVLEETYRESWFVTAFILLIIGLIAAVVSLFYSFRQRNIYRELHENTERLYRALENIPDVVIIYDRTLKIRYVNKAVLSLTGYPPEFFTGKKEEELWEEGDSNKTIRLIQEAFASKKVQTLKTEFTYTRRGTRHLKIIYIPIFGKDRRVKEVMAVINDLTEFLQHQKEYKELINKMHEMVFVVGKDGKFKEVNESALNILGYSKTEFLSIGPADIDLNLEELNVDEYMKSPVQQMYETRYKAKNGSVISVEISNSPISYRGEQSVLNIARDITSRKQSEAQLRLLSRAITQSPVSVVITDAEGTIEYVNPKYTEVTGYQLNEVIGCYPGMLKSDYHSKLFYKSLWETILSGKDWHGEFRNKKKNGELLWESAIISPIIDDHGNIRHFVAVKEDITEKKKMIEDLKNAKEKAEESDKLKTAFVQNISHEIRTPMNGIMGFIDLLESSSKLQDKQMEFIEMIRYSGNRLLNLINDLVEISLIESGETKVYNDKASVNDVVKRLYEQFLPEAEKKGIDFQYQTGLSHNHSVIEIDETKLERILRDLIDNAIKFTNKGTIRFGYTLDGDVLQFYVKDTGIGIPEDIKEVIFDSFRQADSTITRPYEGSGLGLAIAKAYVIMLGGQIWVDTEPEKGSVFYFTLPYKVPGQYRIAEEKSQTKIEDNIGKKTILIVEDDPVSREFIQSVIEESLDVNILHAENGQKSVDMVKENPEIVLVLMDIKLPEMDGFEATIQIKKERPELIVIAQTAYAMENDKIKAFNAGCDDYITKPINHNKLTKLVSEYID
ncbi:MAG: PAS domain S-box protein, partial [Bacteroidia bacterium]